MADGYPEIFREGALGEATRRRRMAAIMAYMKKRLDVVRMQNRKAVSSRRYYGHDYELTSDARRRQNVNEESASGRRSDSQDGRG